MVNRRDFHAEDVKARLRKKFGSLQSFERSAGIKRHSAAACLRRPYAEAEGAIAMALEIPPQILWPSRYDAQGKRLKPQPAKNYRYARGQK